MEMLTIWKKEKKKCHHYNTMLSLYNIILRHYKKSLLRSIYSNIPWIWRIIYGHKLPYMKKTIKKKQVCGAACFMAAEIKFSKDVCPSVRLLHLFHNVPVIVLSWNFRIYYQWQKWCPCKRPRSKVKVTEVKTPSSRFRTVTPVWIDIWWWNDAQILMLLRWGALLFFKVIRKISRSHG